jgi:hypothetical protein
MTVELTWNRFTANDLRIGIKEIWNVKYGHRITSQDDGGGAFRPAINSVNRVFNCECETPSGNDRLRQSDRQNCVQGGTGTKLK